MKKDKGFTLIEVLAVLVILSLLITFSVVSVNKIKKKQEVANRINVIRSILTAARAYEADYPNTNASTGVKVSTLLSKGYVDFDQDKYDEYVGIKVKWDSYITLSGGKQKREFYTSKVYINKEKDLNISDCGLETSQDTSDKGKLICQARSLDTYYNKCEGWNENGKYISAEGNFNEAKDFK